MATPYESARLILQLYDLRREPTMRQARTWFLREFHPETIDDVFAVLATEHNPHLRMVVGYWDMAASLVSHGAIDRQMFLDANNEIVATFAKIHPLLDEVRRVRNLPTYARHMEELVLSIPGVEERMATLRQEFKAMGAPPRD